MTTADPPAPDPRQQEAADWARERRLDDIRAVLLADEELRGVVELALRVPPFSPYPITRTVLEAAAPIIALRLDDDAAAAAAAERDRWTAVVAECRRQIDYMARHKSRETGDGDILEGAALLAARSCETFTTGPGACTRDGSGRYAYARYGADLWCAPCVMWAALNRVPFTTAPTPAGGARG